jgi:SAM-dependent methyltransferase
MFLKTLIKQVRSLLLQGNRYYCPLCDRHFRTFLVGGTDRRPQARCPNCDSLERHRLLWLALQRTIFASNSTGGNYLHVAPESCLEKPLRQQCDSYLSVDMDSTQAMQQMDICHIPLPDQSFDAIICNHVLEHIPDDKQALEELYRVLKPNGWASLQVPMIGEKTQENLSIKDPQIRAQLYGQSDHVRQYGRDFQQRLASVGFQVEIISKRNLAQANILEKMSVDCESEVWLCHKI